MRWKMESIVMACLFELLSLPKKKKIKRYDNEPRPPKGPVISKAKLYAIERARIEPTMDFSPYNRDYRD